MAELIPPGGEGSPDTHEQASASTENSGNSTNEGRQRLPVPLIAATALAGVLVVGLVIAGILVGSGSADQSANAAESTAPVALVPVDAPMAGSAGCTALLEALPGTLPNAKSPLNRRAVAKPAPPATVAWGPGDPVVLRCGIAAPPELTATSELLDVSGVQWLRVSGGAGDNAATWYAVDRPECVALTLPAGVNTGPIQTVSATIAAHLPQVPVHPNG